MNSDHDQVLENVAAYALGALDANEVQAVERHLKNCKTCQGELRAYQSTTNKLGLAPPTATPSSVLKNKVMGQIYENKQPQIKSPQGWFRLKMPRPAWNLVLGLLVAALTISNLLLWQQLNQQQAALQPFQTIPLSSTSAQPEAAGMILISQDGEFGTLVIESLEPLSPELQYQLWLILGEDRTSGGVFSVSPNGYSSLVIDSPKPLNQYDGFGVTIEPTGGSAGPTGDKVLGGEF